MGWHISDKTFKRTRLVRSAAAALLMRGQCSTWIFFSADIEGLHFYFTFFFFFPAKYNV